MFYVNPMMICLFCGVGFALHAYYIWRTGSSVAYKQVLHAYSLNESLWFADS